MVGGRRLHCLTCFFASHTEQLLHLLLLWFCLHDVEATECPPVVHKRVGDTVEFSTCLPSENVSYALWKYADKTVVTKDQSEQESEQFRGRTSLNPTNFSLTLERLTLQDSGDFVFISEVNDKQRPTVTITLQVHAPLTPPVLNVNSTWRASNESCTILLDCISTSDSNVSYTWTVKNQTHSGSRLQYTIRPQEGDTTFTCNISNLVSEQLASETVKCGNNTAEPPKTPESHLFWIVVAAVAAGALFVMIITIVICVCLRRKAAARRLAELTVYLDIADIVAENNLQKPAMTGCTEYDVIRDDRPEPITPVLNSMYDQIQLSRMRMPSESPYQDI